MKTVPGGSPLAREFRRTPVPHKFSLFATGIHRTVAEFKFPVTAGVVSIAKQVTSRNTGRYSCILLILKSLNPAQTRTQGANYFPSRYRFSTVTVPFQYRQGFLIFSANKPCRTLHHNNPGHCEERSSLT
ncbi:MAG: hypothetical protein K0Q79_1795 [Flavipsychrobacter sp.]|jgi:hypothetical protein|nr:hypothetical protein [Flavipsychrobacter sp.]